MLINIANLYIVREDEILVCTFDSLRYKRELELKPTLFKGKR